MNSGYIIIFRVSSLSFYRCYTKIYKDREEAYKALNDLINREAWHESYVKYVEWK